MGEIPEMLVVDESEQEMSADGSCYSKHMHCFIVIFSENETLLREINDKIMKKKYK